MATTQLEALRQQVAANSDVIQSAILLIQGLRQAILDSGSEPAKLQELAQSLESQSNQLAAAIAANTVPPVVPSASGKR